MNIKQKTNATYFQYTYIHLTGHKPRSKRQRRGNGTAGSARDGSRNYAEEGVTSTQSTTDQCWSNQKMKSTENRISRRRKHSLAYGGQKTASTG